MKSHYDVTMLNPLNLDQQHNSAPGLGSENSGRAFESGADPGVLTIGWREWVSLPELDLPGIKVKVDTGARTSAIHAFDIEPFLHADGSDWVAFSVMPIQRESGISRRCKAPLVDKRSVKDSGGHAEERFCISTQLVVGPLTKVVEITLAQRKDMLFRMLLGRTTLVPEFVVNPQLSYIFGRQNARSLYNDQNPDVSQ